MNNKKTARSCINTFAAHLYESGYSNYAFAIKTVQYHLPYIYIYIPTI